MSEGQVGQVGQVAEAGRVGQVGRGGRPGRPGKTLFVCVALFAAWRYPMNAADNARQIVEEAQKRTDARSQRYEGLLQVFDHNGRISDKRWTLERLGSHGQSRVVLRFTLPAEVKGVALLVVNHPDRASDQWMWTPAIERDRRIALQDRPAARDVGPQARHSHADDAREAGIQPAAQGRGLHAAGDSKTVVIEAVLAAAQRPPGNEDSRTDRSSSLGGLRRSFVTMRRPPLSRWCRITFVCLASLLSSRYDGVRMLWCAETSAQALTGRGFVEGRGLLFPQKASNDPTRAVGDLLLREEVFFKPVPWMQLGGALDLRANSHDQVDERWRLDLDDRSARRPRASIRRLTATLTRGPFTVDAGKQFIRWGKADIINPTDRFAPRDFTNVVDAGFLAVTGVRGVAQIENRSEERRVGKE